MIVMRMTNQQNGDVFRLRHVIIDSLGIGSHQERRKARIVERRREEQLLAFPVQQFDAGQPYTAVRLGTAYTQLSDPPKGMTHIRVPLGVRGQF